jgi:importin-9
MKTLDTIYTSFPKSMAPFVNDLLNISLGHLQSLYPAFIQYYLKVDSTPPKCSEDDTEIHVTNLVTKIFDFLGTVARLGKARAWFTNDACMSLINAVFNFTQMTQEDVRICIFSVECY